MKKIFVFLIFACICGSVFAFDSFESLAGAYPERYLSLLNEGTYAEARTNYGEDVYLLAPPDSLGYDLSLEASKAEHSFTVGVAQFVEYPEEVKSLSDSEKLLFVYNKMLRISTLKGIEYISYRAGNKPKTLFTDACMIESPKSRKALPDARVEEVELFKTYYARLTDTKFGGNVYIADYSALKDEVCIEITNNDTIKFKGIKCVEAGDLHMFVDVKFYDEGVLVYAFAVVYDADPDVKVLFIDVSLDGAFITRIKALKDWFVSGMKD